MGDLTLYENKKQKGYSVNIRGEISPNSGYYNFTSMTVGPRTEVVIYDRNNDLFTVHNGSDGDVNVDDINDFATIIEGTIITIKSNSISKDNSAFIKKTLTGEVIPMTINARNILSPIDLIIIILFCLGICFIYTSYIQKKSIESISSTTHGGWNTL